MTTTVVMSLNVFFVILSLGATILVGRVQDPTFAKIARATPITTEVTMFSSIRSSLLDMLGGIPLERHREKTEALLKRNKQLKNLVEKLAANDYRHPETKKFISKKAYVALMKERYNA